MGEDPALAESHFPTGPVGAVLAWIDLLNREMEAAAAAEEVTALRVPQRIRRVVELRLVAMAPHKPALRRALSLLALPWQRPAGAAGDGGGGGCDGHAAGDTSADFSWYTRRATLAADLRHDPRLVAAGRGALDLGARWNSSTAGWPTSARLRKRRRAA